MAAVGIVHLKHRPVFQSNRRQLPAPGAAAIEAEQILFDVQAERSPMAEEDRVIRAAPVRDAKPGVETDS